MDFYKLATINNSTMQELIRKRDEAYDKEQMYRFDCDMYQAMGDSNTAAMYEHLANCEFAKGMEITMQIIKLAEEMGL